MTNSSKLLTLILMIFCHQLSFGLTSSQVTISNGSGPYFYSDDGNCSGTREIPRTAYIAVNITNLSTTDTLWSVHVKLNTISNSSFKLLNSSDDSTIVIGRILPNELEGAFFFIQYPCEKDIASNFDFSISDLNSGVVSFTTTMTTKDIQPAAAGGAIVYQNVVGIDALGILLADTVVYNFGNYRGGEMVFQPVGDTLFPANKIELLGCEVLQSAFSSCGLTVGSKNIFYFNNATGCGAGSSNEVTVVYYYISSLFNQAATFKPYSAMSSGGPIKYSNNYGNNGTLTDTFTTTLNANKFDISKRASCTICTPGDTITYTVKIENTTSTDLMFDRLIDNLPSGYTFVGLTAGSDINLLNSSTMPVAGDSNTLLFEGLIPTNPFPYRSYLVPGNDSLLLIYDVKIPSTSSNTIFTNEAYGQIGQVNLDTATAETCNGCSALPVTLLYFQGQVVGSDVKLSWSTASEINNKGFEIYRKVRQGEYAYLGYVWGNGTTSSTNNYNYADLGAANTYETQRTYKMVQEDFDGSETETFAAVKITPQHIIGAEVFPNPFNNIIHFHFDEYLSSAEIVIRDIQGQLIRSVSVTDFSGDISIDTDDLHSQIYIVEIWNNKQLIFLEKRVKL